MISKIFIITTEGELCYSKTLFDPHFVDNDIIEYLTVFNKIGKKLGGGHVRSLNFTNFNFVYSYDDRNYIYVMVTDSGNSVEEVRGKLEILKREFLRRFKLESSNWSRKIKKIKEFDEFIESQIYIPPKILLVGEDGVGKTTIMNLFPGDTILELDSDMNEIIQKRVALPNFLKIGEAIFREVNSQDLIEKTRIFSPLLNSVDVICIITNSGAGNLSKTKSLYNRLKNRDTRADFYIIANFQDLKNSSFNPEEISESLGIKTFGFSAIDKNAKKGIYNIINEMLEISLIGKNERIINLKE